ncbi:ABC transporter permease [Actinomadura meridiana]|uniref:Transport permease protein n=1 Tax=Actinomadura meridiana TaxID=559626 RepID=A0ABP8BS58_9ACTN
MISRNALYIADRMLRELKRDVRTMFLFIVSPAFVMVLTKGILYDHPETFDRVGLITMGLFPTAPAFLFVAFAVQRERYRGTLEYLMTAPVRRLDVYVGYVIAFTLPAFVQIAGMLAVTYGFLDLNIAGAWWQVALFALLSCVLGVGLGLFSANLAHNELQLTKVLAAMAAPHLMLSGIFQPFDDMDGWMKVLASVAPWRYAVGAVSGLHENASMTAGMWGDLGATLLIVALLSAVSVITIFRRRTA